MPRNTPPQQFGPLLRKLFCEHRRESALTLNQLRQHWTAIAGPEMGSRTCPAKLARGILWIDTPDACWAYELQFFKQDLLNSIQVFIDSSTVTDLRFTVAREAQTPASAEEGQGAPLPPHPHGEPPVGEPTAPASSAGAGSSRPSHEPEAGQNAVVNGDGWDGGDNTVREAFQRMRTRLLKN